MVGCDDERGDEIGVTGWPGWEERGEGREEHRLHGLAEQAALEAEQARAVAEDPLGLVSPVGLAPALEVVAEATLGLG